MIDDVERLAERLNKTVEELTTKDFVEGFTTISVPIKGKEVTFKISEDIATTLKNLDVKVAKILKLFSGPAKLLRAGAILNPDFPASNVIKDQLDAFVFAKHGFIPFIEMARGLVIRKNKGEMYQDWLKSGGYNAVMVAMDKPYLGKRMFKELQKIPVHNKMNFSKNPLHYLRALSELSEEGTRLGLYAKARKKGAHKLDAAYESRDTTIDFSKAGLMGRKYNVITAFFNVAIQGNAKLVEQLRMNPSKAIPKALMAITLPSIVNTLMNYGDPEYHKIHRWQRDLFWCVKVNGHWLRFPKPFVLGSLFGTVPERALELFLDYATKQDHHALENLGHTVLEAFTPPISPTVMSPFWDFAENKDHFTEQFLIPQDLEGVLPEYQYTPATGPTARLISKALQHVPFIGGNDWTSPIHVRHMIESWTGGLGRHTVNMADTALKEAGVQLDQFRIDPSSKTWYESMPILRAFIVRDNTSASADVHRFFEGYEKYKKLGKTIDVESKRLNFNSVMHLMDESDYGTLTGTYDSLMNMFHLIRTIERMPTLDESKDPEEVGNWKRQQIETLYKQASVLAKAGNTLMDRLEEDKDTRETGWEWTKTKVH